MGTEETKGPDRAVIRYDVLMDNWWAELIGIRSTKLIGPFGSRDDAVLTARKLAASFRERTPVPAEIIAL